MEHRIDPTRFHHNWDRSRAPALSIASGDVVEFELQMAGAEQIQEGDSYDATTFRLRHDLPAAGADLRGGRVGRRHAPGRHPVAEPGGVGVVRDRARPRAAARRLPGAVRAHVRPAQRRRASRVCPRVTIPLSPFLGTMGNHPDRPGPLPSFPPHEGGGNMDTRHLVGGGDAYGCRSGARARCSPAATRTRPGRRRGLPGGAGVRHARDACGSPSSSARSARRGSAPPGALTPRVDAGGHHGTMGIGPDLMEGARNAVRETIAWLVSEHGLDARGRLRHLQPGRRPEAARGRRRWHVERRLHDPAERPARTVANALTVLYTPHTRQSGRSNA